MKYLCFICTLLSLCQSYLYNVQPTAWHYAGMGEQKRPRKINSVGACIQAYYEQI